jgi:hypothetical protein
MDEKTTQLSALLHQAAEPSERWEDYYAARLIRHFTSR